MQNLDSALTSSEPKHTHDDVSAIENDREFKAHVYQQLTELQPLLSPESQISVLVQVGTDPEDELVDEETAPDYTLTLVATLGGASGNYKLEAEGQDDNLYVALRIAKQRMLQQLDDAYSSAIDSDERDEQIHSMLHGGMVVH